MITIYPGETLNCEFILPFKSTNCSKAIVSFKQATHLVLEFECTTFTSISNNSCKIIHKLTQTESLKLRNLETCYMQINVYMTNGDREPSKLIPIQIGEQLHRSHIE